ncbi:unnamed protein product [Cylindrotheca closterium]|uniref:Fungal lipase-type domain-containing protein n=1 Tax=Cylindrotheca closterium TaxID=2856 RepID=A0AAD2FCP6_9STRA|nr:unnamed protein product [Cylindrotheca closterium]
MMNLYTSRGASTYVLWNIGLIFIVSLGCIVVWNVVGTSSSINNGNGSDTLELFADQFPSLEETLWMAKLSKSAYEFRHEDKDFCKKYKPSDGTRCEWYDHNKRLGTQVLIVSNKVQKYIAVAFAGTDDIRTSLEDAHATQKPFGNNSTISLPEGIRVHSGFDNAVFLQGMWEQISSRIKRLVIAHPSYRIYSTGHSLGAANSLLTAAALSLQGHKVKSINFGCPQTGNKPWSEFFNRTSPTKDKLAIWRIVLGWDLVPRLPDFFYHAGHTIQLWKNSTNVTSVESYFEHYGNEELHYAGAPPGWNAKPHFIGPDDLTSHFMTKYIEHLEELNSVDSTWVHEFKKSDDPPPPPPIDYDDDVFNDDLRDDWYPKEA